jgi:transposase
MTTTPAPAVPSLDEAARFTPQQVVELAVGLHDQVQVLQRQLDWFKRQLFGQKSERRFVDGHARQLSLGDALGAAPQTAVTIASGPVAAHTRQAKSKPQADGDEALAFFDAARVPVEVIELPAPEAAGLAAEDFEVISFKDSYRIAQRPGSLVVLQYRRPVIKLKASAAIVCAPAPAGVLDGSRADVSLLAGVLVDKFAYHLPLYRQHQRLLDAGFRVSRPWLTQITQQAIALLEPVYEAQFKSICSSRVKAMDETPIKAGRGGPGKLKAAYFWPVYGQSDEVCFPYFDSRRHEHVAQALGLTQAERSVLLSDGYKAYQAYTHKAGVTHARCWAHTRRKLFEARAADPAVAAVGLELIGELYAVEQRIRDGKLHAAKKLDHRLLHAKPIVDRFFAWVDQLLEAGGWLPSHPLTQALAYARQARAGLEVYLTDPEVPIDTNHLERALRVIPLGRKNWLFCWTELGARQVGIIQSLLVTCRLHRVNPYDYLVDVLQRVGQHPANRVHELTPRLWAEHFAANPLRSPLYAIGRSAEHPPPSLRSHGS